VSVATFLAALTALSLLLLLWQITVAARFPVHRRRACSGFAPAITVLKPLKGADTETRACLQSWFAQDYSGKVQLLFGVADDDDPAGAVVRSLLEEHPHALAQLIVCPDRLGANAKVAKLVQMERHAAHDIICVSDADVWVPRDFLVNAVAPLQEAGVGLTNCLYRMARENTWAMRWEAFAVNADFWSQVLQSASMRPMDFALGATMITRREHLEGMGGFTALVDHLADDFELGQRIAQQGTRLALCPVVVECRSAPLGFTDVWSHQLRWARTIRFCQPWPYFFTILSNTTLWPVLWFVAAPSSVGALGAAFCLLTRMVAGGWMEARFTGERWRLSAAPVSLLKDLLQAGIWLCAFAGQRVRWRGIDYRVERGGRLVRLEGEREPAVCKT
jgi:ceramide glucosyltransferase